MSKISSISKNYLKSAISYEKKEIFIVFPSKCILYELLIRLIHMDFIKSNKTAYIKVISI